MAGGFKKEAATWLAMNMKSEGYMDDLEAPDIVYVSSASLTQDSRWSR